MSSESLIGVSSHYLFMDIVNISFSRGQDLEITDVTKVDGEAFAFVYTTSSLQASKLQSEQLSARHEILKTRKTFTGP